ncbi:primase-helicase family protein [Mesorhizobium sp. CN2-181]|uniref:primase-helicase family protein n=1 Tax=Mesorhizobium yinganensis TaxID=3157707 RepID=UPI0032B812A5
MESAIHLAAQDAADNAAMADAEWLSDPATLAKSVGIMTQADAKALFDYHFYIVLEKGGMSVVRQYGEMRTLKSIPKFREAYDHKKMWVKRKDKSGAEVLVATPAASAWLNSGDAPRYRYEVFRPIGINKIGSDFEARRIKNMWRGFAAKKVSGMATDEIKLSEACPTIFEYLWTVVASQRPEVMVYVVKWIADAVQNPCRVAGRTAIVLRSADERTGKTTFIELLVAIFGHEHCFPAARMKDLEGKFSGQFEGKSIVGCNEFYALSTGGRDAMTAEAVRSTIFDLIDNGKATIEPKGIGAYVVDNFMRFVFTTNKEAAMPQGSQGTRFAVFEVSNCRRGDKAFFGKLHEVFERADGYGGELDRFMTILASVPLKGFHPQGDKPVTVETERQAELAATGSKKWLMNLLDRGEMIVAGKGEQFHDGPTYLVTSKAVQSLIELQGGHVGQMSSTAFGREVMNVLAVDGTKDVWVPGSRKSLGGRRIPELKEARKLFEERRNNGMKVDWSNGQTTWSEVTPTG